MENTFTITLPKDGIIKNPRRNLFESATFCIICFLVTAITGMSLLFGVLPNSILVVSVAAIFMIFALLTIFSAKSLSVGDDSKDTPAQTLMFSKLEEKYGYLDWFSKAELRELEVGKTTEIAFDLEETQISGLMYDTVDWYDDVEVKVERTKDNVYVFTELPDPDLVTLEKNMGTQTFNQFIQLSKKLRKKYQDVEMDSPLEETLESISSSLYCLQELYLGSMKIDPTTTSLVLDILEDCLKRKVSSPDDVFSSIKTI